MLHANMLGGLALLMSVVICSSAMAYPVKHPVFPVELTDAEVDSLREQATHVMSLGREQIDEFIVPRTTFYHILCPNCDDGNVSDTYHWLWSPEEPDQIECKFCNMVFPNEEYPLDKETRVTDSTGQEHVYRYWEGEDGYKHFMQMRVENCKKRYMESMAGALAKIYHATGDEPHARQAGIILNRLAEVYPHYSPHGIENWSMFAMKVFDTQPLPRPPNGLQPVPGMAKDLPGYSTPYPYCSTLRGDGLDNWFYSEMSPALARTYDRVADSEAVDALSDELGTDVRRNIEEFHRATANFTRTFPIYLGNMDGSLIRGLAVIGRVIGEPEFVHDALRRVDGILERQFYPDGIWREASPSYHSQTVYSLQSCVEGPLKGYSDPEGYVNPIDGLHIDRFSGASDVPMLEESIAALNRMRLPDGEVTPIHDAWPAANLGRPIPEAREGPVGTALAWAMGHAILGVGAGESGVQANLHFSGGYGHQHADALDLLLFGAGRQLLPDLGYTHTILRPFACSTVAHNSVVVNEANQRSSGDDPPADGALMAWARCGDLLRFCEASSEGAYPDIASLYRRALALVALPGGGGYVVDVFRVTGGDKHDWCLHGSADYDQTLEASLPMQPHAAGLLPPGWARRPWTDTIAQSWNPVVDGVNTLYGLFEDVARGDGAQAWSATFRYADDPSRGLHTSLLGQPDTTVYTAALPSIRRAKESNAAVFDHTMPALLVRREGSDLQSVFAAVHEPFRDAPRLTSVESLPLEGDGAGAVGIVCRGEGFTDYHALTTGPDVSVGAANIDLRVTGRYAFARVVDDEPTEMVLVDGTEVAMAGQSITAPPAAEGNVVDVLCVEAGDDEDALVVDTQIPAREGLPNERVTVEFGDGTTYALAVDGVQANPDGRATIALRHRPGFDLIEGGRGAAHTHHPHRTIPGAPTFRMPNTIHWTAAK